MKSTFGAILIIGLVLGGVYWFENAQASCEVPLAYSIGVWDERFSLDKDEARIAIMEAEAVWENATGKNLFRYDEEADFSVNFVFDERQRLALAEQNMRERLDASLSVNDAIDSTYSDLLNEYEEIKRAYENNLEQYESNLREYNQDVESYNQEGGAPRNVYEELQNRKRGLDERQKKINSMASQLNNLVSRINELGEKGNELVNRHNQNVETYNETFGQERQFTQGDYQGDHINIYTFSDKKELVLVLAHEFGHALSIDHVEDEQSVMFYLMGGQPEPLQLSNSDSEAFDNICGEGMTYSQRYQNWKQGLVDWLKNISVL